METDMKKILEMGGRAAAELDKDLKVHPTADRVTHQDVLLIVQAAVQMAQRDSKLDITEKRLISRMVKVGHVSSQELKEVHELAKEDIGLMIDRLSGRKSRKAFLLAIVAVAMADEDIDPEEVKMIAGLTEKLGVGNIDIEKHKYEEIEDLVLKFVASAALSR